MKNRLGGVVFGTRVKLYLSIDLLIIRMSCYSYKFEDEIRFGIFHEFDIDTWKVNPLILGQEASNIPDVVLDLRQQEVYVSKDTNIMEIYVVHENGLHKIIYYTEME